MTTGSLVLRDAAEPTPLTSPTTISGTNTDGALTAGTLSTPAISFEQAVTDPVATTADIEAAFSPVAPGSVTGTIDEDRNVTLGARLKVDLTIRVALLPGQVYRCAIQPVDLLLSGTHDETSGAVTLADGNFSIPAAPVTDACPDFMANAVNAALQGSGHAITLAMTGPLTAPLDPGEPTTTTLAITPAGPTGFGDAVTLTATVTPDVEGPVPGGFVEFTDGVTPLGTVALDAHGTAQLVTTDIAAGPRRITARYTGTPPIYAVSTDTRALVVTAHPLVVADLPPAVEAGGDPVDVDVTATNTGFGRDITNARIDVTIQRAVGTAAIAPDRLVLSTVDEDGGAEPLALTASGSGSSARLTGSIGATTGVPLAAGESWTTALRLQVNANMGVGPLRVTFTLVEVDGTGAVLDTLATGSDDIEVVGLDRIDTTIAAGNPGIPAVGIPPTPPVAPVRVRAGNIVAVTSINVGPESGGVRPAGELRFSMDGQPLSARPSSANVWSDSIPAGVTAAHLAVPADITGARQVTISYGGDVRYRPAVAIYPVTIEPAIGPAYECTGVGTLTGAFRANLEASVALPVAAPPGTSSMGAPRVRLNFARDTNSLSLFSEINDPTAEPEITVSFGDAGSASAGSVEELNNTKMDAAGTGATDHSVILRQLEGQLDLAGAPGDVVDVAIESIDFAYTEALLGARNTMRCVPVEDALSLGSVTVAGTTVSAEPGPSVREGTAVRLGSVSAPAGAGTVEFLDGTETIGVVPTANGVASMVTDSLSVGVHSVTAVFRSGLGAPTTTSVPVEVTVRGTECAEFTSAGSGAVVRLVYLELLGRCPDQAGFDYWTSRLDGGTSAEVFARSIARTSEAVGRVVDDAYRTMLGRSADAAGRAFWTGRLQASGRYDALLADLGASSEFWTQAGSTNDGFVTRVYDRLLNRAPDADGLTYWTGRLDAGASRRALIVSLANLDEPLGRIAVASYGEILDRAPFASERSDAISFLRATGDRSGLYAQLIGRPEFATRAQSLPNRDD